MAICEGDDCTGDVELETWTCQGDQIECRVTSRKSIYHTVKIRNYRRRTVEVTIEGECTSDQARFNSDSGTPNSKIKFNSKSTKWSKTIKISGRIHKKSLRPHKEKVYICSCCLCPGTLEAIKTRINYKNYGSVPGNPDDAHAEFEIELV